MKREIEIPYVYTHYNNIVLLRLTFIMVESDFCSLIFFFARTHLNSFDRRQLLFCFILFSTFDGKKSHLFYVQLGRIPPRAYSLQNLFG